MTFLGVVGILLGLLSARFAFVAADRLRVSVFALAYILHIAASVTYYVFVQSRDADTALYYYDPMNYYQEFGFGSSTLFIIWVVQIIKQNFGGTYLDFFLLFQAFGFFGIALLMRTIEELWNEVNVRQPLFSYALLLCPSLHWWTTGIGKDAPFFLAIVLGIWASLQLRQRLAWMVLSIGAILAIRPHIALLVLAALFVMALTEQRVAFWRRTALGIATGLGIWGAIATMQTLNIDITNPETLSFAMEVRENVLNSADSGDSRVDGAYPVRVLSLLFRPLFFDAEDMFGYLASVENVLIVLLFAFGLLRLPSLLYLTRRLAFVRFSLTAVICIIGFQALTYYNVGLGLRQKWTMILPFLLVLFVTVVAFRRARANALVAGPVLAVSGKPAPA